MATPADPRWPRTIGIVGGMGPHAHIAFEAQLLASVVDADGDQDYPPWILSSLPATPDRTAAILEGRESPLPWLVASLENLRGRADFAVVACNTAHHFLDEAGRRVGIPVLHMVRETVAVVVGRHGPGARVGLLATTGTLRAAIYPEAAAAVAPNLEWRSPRDLPGGDELQDRLVMSAIYGESGRGGLKTGRFHDPHSGEPYADRLTRAGELLLRAGCHAVVLGCTEVSLALRDQATPSSPWIDPVRLTTERCLEIAAGKAPLPTTEPSGDRNRPARAH